MWAQLERAGVEPVRGLPVEEGEPVLLLYDPPDRLLASSDLDGPGLLEGYRVLLAAPANAPRLTVWRLAALDAEELGRVVCGDMLRERSIDFAPPEPDPLAALVSVALCRSVPGLLDAYLDLELQALLVGGEPDSGYMRRLQSSFSAEELLAAWRTAGVLTLQVAELGEQLEQSRRLLKEKENALAAVNQELEQQEMAGKEARGEAELSLLQLQQVQEHYFLRSRSSDQELAAQAAALLDAEARGKEQGARLTVLEAEVVQLRRERDEAFQGREQQVKRMAEVQEELSSQAEAFAEVREEAEFNLVQLHKVQEELEHYFLSSRGQDQQVAAQAAGLLRAEVSVKEQGARLVVLEAEVVQLGRERDEACQGRVQQGMRLAELEQQLSSKAVELTEVGQRLHSRDQLVGAQAAALLQAEVRGKEQGARLVVLEAEVVQLGRERTEATQGHEQQGKRMVEMEQELSSKAEALREAKEEGERHLLQLQQVQEELEHYFMHSRSSDELVAAQAEQNGRAFALLGRMLQLRSAPGGWLPEYQEPPLISSRSKRFRLRWGR